jgi:hypothetical protein
VYLRQRHVDKGPQRPEPDEAQQHRIQVRRRWGALLFLGLLGAGFWFATVQIHQIRGQGDNFAYDLTGWRTTGSISPQATGVLPSATAEFIIYAGGPAVALDTYLRMPQHQLVWGNSTFGSYSEPSAQGLAKGLPHYYLDVYIPGAMNVFTVYRQFYEDFGWAGVVVIPFVLGWLAQIASRRFARSPAWTALYLVLACNIAFSPFFSLAASGSVLAIGALTWLCLRAAGRRSVPALGGSRELPTGQQVAVGAR